MKVGIPRSLFYFYYFPLWKTFFEGLGAEVVTSSWTNRQTVEAGLLSAVDEACFPIKVCFGHVQELCRKELDYIFIPRLVSIEARSYICPKFMGLPDMVRASLPSLPEIIDITVDLSRNGKTLEKDLLKIGRRLGRDSSAARQAYGDGLAEWRRCRQWCRQGYSMAEAIRIWDGEELPPPSTQGLNIGVLGHGYSLYDQMISMDLINRLRKFGCQVQVVENLDQASVEAKAAEIPKRVFWTLGRKAVGGALLLDNQPDVDGIVYLACFGCGPDSMVGEIISRKVRHKPFMMLTIDEHTAEAGLVTRLEAFCDMLHRKKAVNL
ncbi:MAG: acyl-CoA dehydratase activase-related protein [Syntrophomonadaceae bacterium]